MHDDRALTRGDEADLTGQPLDQYRRLVDSLTDYAIFGLDADGRIVNWNSGATTTFGYTADEVVGTDYGVLFTADDIASGRPVAELVASLKYDTTSVDGWHARKDGSRFWCTDTIQAIRSASGSPIGFTKIVKDSTDSYNALERLRESEERLRLLIEGVTDYAIFSIGLDGDILFWNSGAEHLFGYTEAEVLGKHFSLVYTDEAIARGVPVREIAAAAKHGRASDEGWHVRRDGTPFYASGQLMRLKPDAAGRPRGFVKIAHDMTSRNDAVETIKRRAFHDELTQLPNRAYLSDCLRRAVARVKRQPAKRFAVVFIDLDRFKVINDSLGHVLADGLLVHVARTIEECVRPDDIVARFGGDEFTVLVSEVVTAADAVRVADRIQTALQRPFFLDGVEVFTTASMGIAVGSATYDHAEQLLRDADTAMYEAKARGRARHVLFDHAMHDRAVGLLNLQMDLRRALARGEFFLEYQPIVSLDHERAVGFEALVRWNHPERGVVPPGEFLGEAENMGLIIQIDRWVLREACRQLRIWQAECGDRSLTVSVNLSGKQFAHEDLLEEIRGALRDNDVSADSLKVEITETVLMDQFDATMTTMAQIGELGVELYIDDFGTGYSSLSYLTKFPLKLLKVDRSFVSQVSSSARSAVIARSVVALAHNLNLGALAEGIESEQQLAFMRELGCELGQGYWFSKPVSARVAQTFIGRVLPLATA